MRHDRPSAPKPPGIDTVSLFEAPAPTPGSIDESFAVFHAANPWVADRLTALARDLLARGHTKIGIGMLFEVLRWQTAMATTDAVSDFKLNNTLRSRYARFLMDRHPDLEGVFETRRLLTA